MRTLGVLSAIMLLSAPAVGDVVTERWGAAKPCQHAGTVKYAPCPAGGAVATFDLAALPKGARIIRARFLASVRTGGPPLAQPLAVQALADPVLGKAQPRTVGKPMALVAPRFTSLDATEIVRGWASGMLANHGLWVRGAKFDQARTCLEVTYEGTLKNPPPPVTGLRAFYRAGQVFLTWKEVHTPFAGKDKVQWKDLQADLKRIGAGKGPVVIYRIYRHTRPITPKTLADTELLAEVGQHSALDQRQIRTEWKGERIKNVRLAEAIVPTVGVKERKALPAGTGVWVRTCRQSGPFHYAVVSTADGVENTVALNAGNTAGPLSEKVAPTQPILFREQKMYYQKKRTQHCYVWWLDPPLSITPTFIHLSLSPPEKPGDGPHPMVVYHWWWTGGWASSVQYPLADGVGFVIDHNCMRTRGIHDGYGTYKAWSQGKVVNFVVRRFRALLPWIKARYNIDEDRVYAQSSGWAWHYPDLFAATFECTTMNPKRSPAGNECKRYWGPVTNPAPTEWGVSAWEYWNAGEWIKHHPQTELAPMTYAPRMHTGDFGRLDKPPLYRALLDTKRAWSTVFHEGPLEGHRAPGWMYQLRRTDSVPAFGNCSIDDNPGIGFGWDPGGQMNAYLCAEPRTQVDRPGRWEMTVYLYAGDRRGRNAAPLDRCTADVTPRRCQRFKARPGGKFTWTNTSVAARKVIQTGAAVADKRGLVTAKKVVISKGKNRLVILRAK